MYPSVLIGQATSMAIVSLIMAGLIGNVELSRAYSKEIILINKDTVYDFYCPQSSGNFCFLAP